MSSRTGRDWRVRVYSGCRSRNRCYRQAGRWRNRRVRARTGWGHGERWRIGARRRCADRAQYGCAGRWWRRGGWQAIIFNSADVALRTDRTRELYFVSRWTICTRNRHHIDYRAATTGWIGLQRRTSIVAKRVQVWVLVCYVSANKPTYASWILNQVITLRTNIASDIWIGETVAVRIGKDGALSAHCGIDIVGIQVGTR